jgi:transposase
MPMSAIAKELGESDNTLWRVFNYYIERAVEEQIDLTHTTEIYVDETSKKKGHEYITIFCDRTDGNVILVEDGRKKEVFSKLYDWLYAKSGSPKNIELFSMDMSKSYKAGCADNFPKSEIVFDRFHIKKLVNEAVNNVRKSEVIESDELKGTKYIWLKNEQNLTTNQLLKLNDFLRDSTLKTTIAYQMKTAFDRLWNVQSLAVKPLLDSWMTEAIKSNLAPFEKLVKSIRNNYEGILKSMKTKITNAAAEGLNSIVQMAKSRARGFRNIDNFKNMVYYIGNDFIFDFHIK